MSDILQMNLRNEGGSLRKGRMDLASITEGIGDIAAEREPCAGTTGPEDVG